MPINMKKTPQTNARPGIISERANRLSPSGIRKFFDLLASMDGVISLGVGEPDYATPWHISEAAVKSLEKGYTMYTSNSGMPELRELTAHYLKEKYGVEYDPAGEILITVGVSEALDLAMRAILNPGDEVIMPGPALRRLRFLRHPRRRRAGDGADQPGNRLRGRGPAISRRA